MRSKYNSNLVRRLKFFTLLKVSNADTMMNYFVDNLTIDQLKFFGNYEVNILWRVKNA